MVDRLGNYDSGLVGKNIWWVGWGIMIVGRLGKRYGG